jgi:hypothetical protein
MNILFKLSCALLLFASLSTVYAGDSSAVLPATINANTVQSKITVTVAHYQYDATFPNTFLCPSNGAFVKGKYYPWFGDDSNASGNGAVYYQCNETYWPSDTYYQNLQTNNWVSCNQNPYSHPTTGEYCSIQNAAMKPMLLRVLVPIPRASIVTYKVSTGAGGFTLIPFAATPRLNPRSGVAFGSASQYLNKTSSTSEGYFGTTILYGGATSQPTLPATYNINYSFDLQIDGTGPQGSGTGAGAAKQYNCFDCAGNYAHYLVDWTYIPITYDQLGQTCIVSYTGLWTDNNNYYYTPSHPGANSFEVSCSP